MRLCVGHQHSQFLANSDRLVDYYSLFWGPGVISTIDEPLGAFTCRSSTITVLADSDPFHGLLLTVLGFRAISTIDEPRGAFTCWPSTLAVFVDSGPFRGLLLTVLGSQRDFHFCRTPRCACVLVVKTRSFGRFRPVLNYYTVLASRSDFHD